MVDALRRAARLTASRGRIIDIHPTAEPAHVEVRTASGVLSAGDLTDDGTELGPARRHAAADRAIALVLASGAFALEAQAEIAFHRHADSPLELQQYVTATRTHSWISDTVRDCAGARLAADPRATLWLREQVRLSRLRPEARG
jgi:hypothetical protein